jgi:hypothetical protein
MIADKKPDHLRASVESADENTIDPSPNTFAGQQKSIPQKSNTIILIHNTISLEQKSSVMSQDTVVLW